MSLSVYSKVEADPTIDLPTKSEAIFVCAACTAELGKRDDHSVEKRFDDFSRGKVALGTLYATKSDESFGHVKVFEDWGDRLHRMTGDPIDLVKKNMRIICGLIPAATKQQVALARRWLESRLLGLGGSAVAKLTGPFCFIFLPDSSTTVEEMFRDEPEPLPCRLGLPSFWDESWGTAPPAGTTQQYVGYVLPAEKLTNVRSVTVFHPGYRSVRDLWQPGGKTEPHPNGPAKHIALGGLDELVCDQVQATDAREEVFGFEVRY